MIGQNLIDKLTLLSSSVAEYNEIKAELDALKSELPTTTRTVTMITQDITNTTARLVIAENEVKSNLELVDIAKKSEPKPPQEQPSRVIGSLEDPAVLADYLSKINTAGEIGSKIIPFLNNPEKLLSNSLDIFASSGYELNIKIPRGSSEREVTLVGANDVVRLYRAATGSLTEGDKNIKPEDVLSALVIKAEKEFLGISIVETAQEMEALSKAVSEGLKSEKDVVSFATSKIATLIGNSNIPPETKQQLQNMLMLGKGIMDAIIKVEDAYEAEMKALADKMKAATEPETSTTTTVDETTTTTVEGETTTELPEGEETTTTTEVPAPSPEDQGATDGIVVEVKDDANVDISAIEEDFDPYEEEVIEDY